MELFRSSLSTPFGAMKLAVDDDGAIVELWLPNRGRVTDTRQPFPEAARRGTDLARAQLDEYLRGQRRTFELDLNPIGTTFERRVWTRLRDIPYGATISYGEIASEFGLANRARAVGRANGANPIPIIIPCHRVIGADGTLTGFGGGLPLKAALLELEGAIAPPPPRLF